MTEITINGRKWWLQEDLEFCNQWTSNYYSSDGDGITLYIDNDLKHFELSCFSGIGCSTIDIDSCDYGRFQYKPFKVENLDFHNKLEVVLRIADSLCRTFCTYKN